MNDRTKLVVKGDKDKLFEILTDIEGVVSVKFEKEVEDVSYLTLILADKEIKESIFNQLAKQKIPIYRMQ